MFYHSDKKNDYKIMLFLLFMIFKQYVIIKMITIKQYWLILSGTGADKGTGAKAPYWGGQLRLSLRSKAG